MKRGQEHLLFFLCIQFRDAIHLFFKHCLSLAYIHAG